MSRASSILAVTLLVILVVVVLMGAYAEKNKRAQFGLAEDSIRIFYIFSGNPRRSLGQ